MYQYNTDCHDCKTYVTARNNMKSFYNKERIYKQAEKEELV